MSVVSISINSEDGPVSQQLANVANWVGGSASAAQAQAAQSQQVTLPTLSPNPAGTYGDSTNVVQFTVGANGLVTGAKAVPIAYPSPSISTAPDFAKTLSDTATNGNFIDWTWGDVTLSAPAAVTYTQNLNGVGLDMHGAKLISGLTGGTSDLLTFIIPTTAQNLQVRGFDLRNLMVFGQGARNGIVLSSPSHANGLYSMRLDNVQALACGASGAKLYGSVFECTITAMRAADNGLAGLELRNPAQGAGGVISSVWVYGGDFRTNLYGLLTSADIAFQEPSGVYVFGGDYIANNGPAMVLGAGGQLVDSCHMENNCNAATPADNCAVKVIAGAVVMRNVNAPENNDRQTSLLNLTGNGGESTILNSWCSNENTWAPHPAAVLSGTGSILTDHNADLTQFVKQNGAGAWTINKMAAVATVL